MNRKHLEVNVSIPPELSHFEIEVKKWISSAVTRGSVSVKITAYFENKTPFLVRPNLPLPKQLKQAWDQIAHHLKLDEQNFNLSLLSAT